MNNCFHYKVRDEITFPFPNFNGEAVHIYWAYDFLFVLGLRLIHVNNRVKVSGLLRKFILKSTSIKSMFGHVFSPKPGLKILVSWRVNSSALQWRHNKRDGVWNHRCLDCSLNRLSRCRSKKTSKLRVSGLCDGNSRWLEFLAQSASNAKTFPFDDVIIVILSPPYVSDTGAIVRLPQSQWNDPEGYGYEQ